MKKRKRNESSALASCHDLGVQTAHQFGSSAWTTVTDERMMQEDIGRGRRGCDEDVVGVKEEKRTSKEVFYTRKTDSSEPNKRLFGSQVETWKSAFGEASSRGGGEPINWRRGQRWGKTNKERNEEVQGSKRPSVGGTKKSRSKQRSQGGKKEAKWGRRKQRREEGSSKRRARKSKAEN